MKKLLTIISIAILSFSLVACRNNKETDFKMEISHKYFTVEEHKTYVDHRRNKDYNGSLVLTSNNKEAFFYIWGDELRTELRFQVDALVHKLEPLLKERKFKYEVNFDENLFIKYNGRELFVREKSEETALLALMLPKTFYATKDEFRNSLIRLSMSLESINQNVVTEVKTTSTTTLKYHYSYEKLTKDTFYSFKSLEDIESIMKDKYVLNTNNFNTGEVIIIEKPSDIFYEFTDGNYLWLDYKNTNNSSIEIFTSLVPFEIAISLYDGINGTLIESFLASKEPNLSQNLDIQNVKDPFIKIEALNSKDSFMSIIHIS